MSQAIRWDVPLTTAIGLWSPATPKTLFDYVGVDVYIDTYIDTVRIPLLYKCSFLHVPLYSYEQDFLHMFLLLVLQVHILGLCPVAVFQLGIVHTLV